MSQSTLEAAFPRRPLNNKGWFLTRAAFMFVVMLAVAGGIGYFLVMDQLPSLLVDQTLSDPANREETVAGSVGGECRSKLFVSHCTLDVKYRLADNVSRQAEVSMSFFGDIDDKSEMVDIFTVKGDPSKVGVTWGIDRMQNRWGIFAIAAAIGLLCLWGGFFIPIKLLQQRSGFLAALAASKPAAVRVLGTAKAKVNQAFAVEDENGVPGTGVSLRQKGDLFWLNEADSMALALRGEKDTYYLIKATGYPTDLSASELEGLRRAYMMGPAVQTGSDETAS